MFLAAKQSSGFDNASLGIFLVERRIKWISKAPGKKISVTNLLQIFDITSRLLILASMVVMSLMLITVHKIQHQLGGESQDISLSIITPLAMLTAENLSMNAFNSKVIQLFTRNFLLLLWSVMGTIVVFCFLCNLRAMLLKPARDSPIDTTEGLMHRGKIPIIVTEGRKHFLAASPNEWQKKAAENALVLPDPTNITSTFETLVQRDGTHAMMINLVGIAWRLKDQEKQIPIHFSEENLYSYYLGWVLAKKSPWKNMVDNHLGLYKQVSFLFSKLKKNSITFPEFNLVLQAGLHQKQERTVLRYLKPASKQDLEKIELVNIILPLSLLATGWIISTIQFLVEKFR